MGQLNFGVKIYLKTAVTPDANLGLYDESGVSVFRWSSDTVSTTDIYKTGILSENFINDISQLADIRTGGNQATIQGTSIGVDNTSKFWDSVEDLDISFIGSKVEIFVIDNEVAHAGTYANETKIYYGKCSDPVYTAGEYVINVSDVYEGRNAQTGKVITSDLEVDENGVSLVDEDSIGKMIPITIGVHQKAKYQKITGRFDLEVKATDYTSYTGDYFPLISQDSDTTFQISVGATWTDETGYSDYLDSLIAGENLFIKVVRGDGLGEIRQVTAQTTESGSGQTQARVNITTSEGLEGLITYGTDTNTDSWFKLFDIRIKYACDYWNMNEAVAKDIFIVDNSEYSEYPESSFETTATANEVVLKPKFLEDENLNGWSANSVEVSTMTATEANRWDIGSSYISNTLFTFTASGSATFTESAGFNGFSDNQFDSNQGYFRNAVNTEVNAGPITSGDTYTYAYGVKIKLPKLTKNISRATIGVYGDFTTIENTTNTGVQVEHVMSLYKRDWVGDKIELVSDSVTYSVPSGGYLKSTVANRTFPDWKNAINENKSFYNTTGINGITSYPDFVKLSRVEGKFYDLNISSLDDYNSIPDVALIFEKKIKGVNLSVGDTFDFDDYITGIVVCYEYTQGIEDELFTGANGRGTDSNNTSDSVGVISAFKMIKNLQNWTDASISVPSGGWGTESVAGLIDETTGSGGTTNADFGTFGFDSMNCARQILDLKESETKELSRSLCKNYSLMSWVNPDGYESICQIARKTGNSITQTVNRADILGQITVSERKSNEIYCQPTIYYDYDYGLDKWNKTINVSNVTEALATDQEKIDTVSGDFTDAQKLDIWERCRALYVRYGIINKAPSDLSELKWIRNKNTAYACMVMFLENQGAIKTGASTYAVVPRLFYTFTMDYSEYLAKGLEMGSRFYLNHPYYTNSGNAECLIHGVRISPRRMEVTINALGYDATANYSPTYQNTNDNLNPNWQNTNNNANTNYENTNQGF